MRINSGIEGALLFLEKIVFEHQNHVGFFVLVGVGGRRASDNGDRFGVGGRGGTHNGFDRHRTHIVMETIEVRLIQSYRRSSSASHHDKGESQD